MQPIVFKYANASGFTDFVEGLIPDHPMEENLLFAEPFGSLRDPFMARAIELISGKAPAALKSASVPVPVNFRTQPEPRKHISEQEVDWNAIRAIRE
jgi:hypothetical protein